MYKEWLQTFGINARNCRRWRKVRAHYATVGEALRVNLKILEATTKPNSESD